MRVKTAVLSAVAVGFFAMSVPIAHADNTPQSSNTKTDVYSCIGRATACSANGPSAVDDGEVVGFTNYRMTSGGDLRLVLSVKGVAPNATMQVDLGCDAWFGSHKRPVGSITTNADGNGTVQITVPAAVLLTTCGAGNHAGHIDVYDANHLNSTYLAALGIQFSA